MKGARVLPWLTPLIATGCVPEFEAPTAPAAPRAQTLVERLATEAEGIDRLLAFESLVALVLLILLAVLLQRAVSFAVRMAWRLGLDANRRLSGWDSASRIVLAGAVVYLVAHRAATAAPILFALTVVVLIAAASQVFASQLRNVWVGMGLALRRRLRTGDRIKVGEHEGIVRDVGLSQTTLRKTDGSTVLVPNRLLAEDVVTVAREKNSVPVSVRIVLAERSARSDLEKARRVGLLSPYRAPGSAVEVERDTKEPTALTVQIQVWAERAAREAADHLDASLRAALAPKDEAGR